MFSMFYLYRCLFAIAYSLQRFGNIPLRHLEEGSVESKFLSCKFADTILVNRFYE